MVAHSICLYNVWDDEDEDEDNDDDEDENEDDEDNDDDDDEEKLYIISFIQKLLFGEAKGEN